MVNVGKYTSPMDYYGNGLIHGYIRVYFRRKFSGVDLEREIVD